ncbi:leucine-rich repeat and fibronectin type-III domain-containing protein 5, partial [Mytilus galloprovincialis]
MKVGISVLVCLLVIDTGLVKGSCPSVCFCSDPYNAHVIDCRSRSLGNIPVDLLNDTLQFWLQENNITAIDVQFCKKMPQLHYLYINDNQISAIPVNTFVDCEQLYGIDLRNNNISTLESFTFMNLPRLSYLILNGNNISHIEEHAFGTFTSLYELDLESNPLNCDCTIYPFWSWYVGRANLEFRYPCERDSATCSNGTLVKSLQVDALTKCNPANFQCFNGGKYVTRSNGHVVCECIGNWTGNFCQ